MSTNLSVYYYLEYFFLLSKIMWQTLLASLLNPLYQAKVTVFKFLGLVASFSRGMPSCQEMPEKLCCALPLRLPQVACGQ